MKEVVVRQLLELNRSFYEEAAGSFARSRTKPQPGFHRLLSELPSNCDNLLDAGCGDGRLGRFLLARKAIRLYTGVDFSRPLLERAQATTAGAFHRRDVSRAGCLDGLGAFPVITCLATLQHIPGRERRLNLLKEMKAHLNEGGRLILSNWQFLDSERQRRKIAGWPAVGLDETAVDPGDYLITWRRGRFALRYVSLIDEIGMGKLAAAAGLTIIKTFRSDGHEGNLNLYTVCER